MKDREHSKLPRRLPAVVRLPMPPAIQAGLLPGHQGRRLSFLVRVGLRGDHLVRSPVQVGHQPSPVQAAPRRVLDRSFQEQRQ